MINRANRRWQRHNNANGRDQSSSKNTEAGCGDGNTCDDLESLVPAPSRFDQYEVEDQARRGPHQLRRNLGPCEGRVFRGATSEAKCSLGGGRARRIRVQLEPSARIGTYKAPNDNVVGFFDVTHMFHDAPCYC